MGPNDRNAGLQTGSAAARAEARAAYSPFTTSAEKAFEPARRADARTSLVVLDTNVLLEPYRTSSSALAEIQKVYGALKKGRRLLVPAEVAREFARNRPGRLAEVQKTIRNASSASLTGKHALPAIVQGLNESTVANGEYKKLLSSLRSYQAALSRLANEVGGWTRTDPVLDIYTKLFDAQTVVDCGYSAEAIEKIRHRRYAAKIPPGYEDAGKADGGRGDLVIWLTILEVASAKDLDAIFVSDDRKKDWAHPFDADSVFPRYELVAEFDEVTGGKTFELMTLATLLERLDSPPDIVAEVRFQEQQSSGERLKRHFRTLLYEAAGRGVAEIRSSSAAHFDLTESDRSTAIEVRTIRYVDEPRFNALAANLADPSVPERVVIFVAVDETSIRFFEKYGVSAVSPATMQVIAVKPINGGFVTFVNHAASPMLRELFVVGQERVE